MLVSRLECSYIKTTVAEYKIEIWLIQLSAWLFTSHPILNPTNKAGLQGHLQKPL